MDYRARQRAAVGFSTYGLPARLMATLTGVHLDTARRWKRAGNVPGAFSELLELRLTADLGILDFAWRGWCIADGWLWTPEGERFQPRHIHGIPHRYAELQALRAELRTLTAGAP